ncbi:MAG: radical SAM/SPASM domain-containing protein [Bacteroidota bacterium]
MNKSSFTELRLLISCFTFYRFINLIKLALSWICSKVWSKPILWGFPYAISIEPTSQCNLHCVECPSGTGMLQRPSGQMSLELFKTIIDQVSKYSFYINLYFQGEPLIHPRIGDMIAYAKSKKMFVFTSTNGHFITQKNAQTLISSKLDKLIISIDGANQEDYEKYRVGGVFIKVIDGLKELSQQKKQSKSKTPIIIAQVLLLKTTEDSIDKIQNLVLLNGANIVEFKKAQFYNPNKKDCLLPKNSQLTRYRYSEEKGWHLKQNNSKGCKRLWSTIVITWDGNILPCCYDKDAKYPYNSMSTSSIFEAYRSINAREFRNRVHQNKSAIDICQNCGE